jgi:hypothetical protein
MRGTARPKQSARPITALGRRLRCRHAQTFLSAPPSLFPTQATPLQLHAYFLAQSSLAGSPRRTHKLLHFPSSLLPFFLSSSPPSSPSPQLTPLPSNTQPRWCNQQFSASLAWVACVTSRRPTRPTGAASCLARTSSPRARD